MIYALMFSQLVTAPSIFRSVYTLPKLLAVVAVLLAASWLRPGRRDAGIYWLWALFLSAFAVSTYYSFAWSMSLCGIYLSGCETMLLATVCFLTFRAAQAGDPKDALEAGAAAAAVSVVLAAFMTTQGGRWVGPTGQAARYGTALAMGAAMAMSGRRWASALPLILIGLVMSGSRGGILAVVVAYAYLYRRIPWWVGALASVAVLIALNRAGSWVQSDIMRVAQAKAGWAVFLQHPWIGCGPATFLPVAPQVNQFHTHILPLNVLATQGLLGALAWGLLAIDAWRGSSREVRAVYVAAAVCSMFNPLPESAYIIMAVLYGASRKGALVERRPWARRVALGALAAWLGIMALADRRAELGEREFVKENNPAALAHFNAAHRLNPLEFYYFAKTYKR